jgi:hypothetical protein
MATKSTAEWAAELEKAGGPVASPQVASPAAMAPTARLLWLRQVLLELGLPSDFLAGADAASARARELRSAALVAQQEATVRRAAALNVLVADPAATVADAATQWSAEAIWLDVQQGQTRPVALELADQGAKRIEGEISAQIWGHAPRLFSPCAA